MGIYFVILPNILRCGNEYDKMKVINEQDSKEIEMTPSLTKQI